MTEVVQEKEVKQNIYPIIAHEEIEYCKLKVHYEADPEIVETKIEEAVASLRKIKIPGFRPGHAPDQAIKIRLRPQINQYVAREMATFAMDDLVFETNIKPIGVPKFSNVSIKGTKFSCDIEVTRKPDFTVSEYKFEVQKPKMTNSEETLAEKSLYNLRLQVGESTPYEETDTVERNDQITFSFTATIDVDGKQEPFDGSTVEGELYQVGSDRWTGFDEHLIGMKAGDARDFDFTFQNGPKELLGKVAKFSVTVHMGMKRKPHPLNEEFYKTMGVENVEVLLERLRSIARSTIQRSEQESIRNQVANKLIENTPFDVPKFLIEGEAKHIAYQSQIKFEDLSADEKEHLLKQAEHRVRLTLILDTIRESEPDSVMNDGEAQNHLVQHLQARGQDPSALFNNKAAHSQLAIFIAAIKDEFTLQWVANQAVLIEEEKKEE
jgi:trigger factor